MTAARDAAHVAADPYVVPCPRCGAAQYVACASRWGDPHPLRIIDAALAAALPLLTPEDVPHVVAQALREAADDLVAEFGVTNRAANRLRARADRLDPKETA